MLSSSFDIKEFVEKVQDNSEINMFYLTDQELVAVERLIYRTHCHNNSQRESEVCPGACRYAVLLKDFVMYLRHGVLSRAFRQLDLTLPNSLSQSS